jgi:hypothetical protein
VVFLGCRGCGRVEQVREPKGTGFPRRCPDCRRRLELITAEESRQMIKRRLADRRLLRLSQAMVAEKLHGARRQGPRGGSAL